MTAFHECGEPHAGSGLETQPASRWPTWTTIFFCGKLESFRIIATELQQAGVRMELVRGDDLIGEDSEGTTDGSHPNDLGTSRSAEKLLPVFRTVLETSDFAGDVPK